MGMVKLKFVHTYTSTDHELVCPITSTSCLIKGITLLRIDVIIMKKARICTSLMHANYHHTCASNSLHELYYLVNVCRERLDLCDIGVAVTVVPVGYHCDANARYLLLKAFDGVSYVTSDLCMIYREETIVTILYNTQT